MAARQHANIGSCLSAVKFSAPTCDTFRSAAACTALASDTRAAAASYSCTQYGRYVLTLQSCHAPLALWLQWGSQGWHLAWPHLLRLCHGCTHACHVGRVLLLADGLPAHVQRGWFLLLQFPLDLQARLCPIVGTLRSKTVSDSLGKACCAPRPQTLGYAPSVLAAGHTVPSFAQPWGRQLILLIPLTQLIPGPCPTPHVAKHNHSCTAPWPTCICRTRR